MSTIADAGFVADPPPRRRSAAAAPLSIWPWASIGAAIIGLALAAWFAFGQTPMPTDADARSYSERFADLDRQVAALRKTGADPLVVVFIGTSRMRNAALDPAGVAAAARRAGVTRPVASTVLGVNWGGFERFEPALPMIEARHADAIVVMPELLTEDFTYSSRMQIGLQWLQAKLRNTDYEMFGPSELTARVCLGFVGEAGERFAEADRFVGRVPNSIGPAMGRTFLRRMAESGTKIIVAEVPVTHELAALRPPPPGPDALLKQVGLAGAWGVEAISLTGRVPRAAYCDYAHVDPAKAAAWQDPFFSAASGAFNRPAAITAAR